jgi:hypothetical protein
MIIFKDSRRSERLGDDLSKLSTVQDPCISVTLPVGVSFLLA